MLARARQLAETGIMIETEACLVEVATALQSMERRHNGGGVCPSRSGIGMIDDV